MSHQESDCRLPSAVQSLHFNNFPSFIMCECVRDSGKLFLKEAQIKQV